VKKGSIFFVGIVFISSVSLFAEDWPQWRGPHRNGISSETGLLEQWPKEGPKQVWQATDLGSGYSTPAVVGDRLYLLSNKGLEDESVLALSAADGKKVWSTRLGKVGNPQQQPSYPAARSTPTVDGNVLYALGSDGDLRCLDRANGKALWTKNLRTDFNGAPGRWAYAESPLIDGDTLICTPGGSSATIVALKKDSGDVIWKCATPEGDEAGYASIVIMESGGVKQYVQFLQKALVGVDARSGKFLWRYDRTAKGSMANIPTAVADDGFVYSASGRTGGGLVKLNKHDEAFEAEQVYFSMKLPNSIGGSVKLGDYLYGTSAQALLCIDFKTGTQKWEEKSIAPASICYADKRFYLHGENGNVALVEATPETCLERGRFTPANPPERGQSKAWAYPVVTNGRLYIRDAGSLWCYDIRSAH
jgi:outer membrane protein assembly factor BamB